MEIFNSVKEVIIDKLGVAENQITPEARFIEDLGADSIMIVELVMGLEDKFSLSISDEDSENIRTVQDAVDYVEKHQ